MADAVREQICTAAAAALTGLPTSAARVFKSRTRAMEAIDLPGLRVYANDESISTSSMGIGRRRQHMLDLVVECCSKKTSAMDTELNAMVKEVIATLDANQGIGGAKYVEPRRIEIDMDGDAEKDVGVARITFEVPYYTAQGAPDVAH